MNKEGEPEFVSQIIVRSNSPPAAMGMKDPMGVTAHRKFSLRRSRGGLGCELPRNLLSIQSVYA